MWNCMTKYQQIMNFIRDNSELSTKEIAEQLGVSRRHVRRTKALFKETMPKILLLDIETAPMIVLTWQLFKQHVTEQQIVKDRSILCWCAKWLYDDKIIGSRVSGSEAVNGEDYSIMQGIHQLLDEADIVITHNGNKFDLPILNSRFIVNGFDPVSPYQSIDTYKVVRKHFGFDSNKLDQIAKHLGIARKSNAPYKWWYDAVVYGDDGAVQNLFEYCQQDIVVLEEVYTELRPWIKSHPNMNLYIDSDSELCPNCGSDDLNWKGFYYTTVNKYRAFQCNSCGAIGRSRFTSIPKDRRKIIVTSVAR